MPAHVVYYGRVTVAADAGREPEPLLTLRGVQARLGTSYEHVLGLVHACELRAIDVGTARKPMYRVDALDLEDYLRRRATVPAPAESGEAA